MTLIGLISDVHATPEPVAQALRIFRNAGVKQVLCAGDVAGYSQPGFARSGSSRSDSSQPDYGAQLEATISLIDQPFCHTIIGNHDLSDLSKYEQADDNTEQQVKHGSLSGQSLSFLKQLPACYQMESEGKSLYMVHAQPPDGYHGGIKLLDKNGLLIPQQLTLWSERLQSFDYDVLVVGHTHQVFAEYLGDTLVINPGSSVFNNSCAILRLPEMSVEMIPLSGKEITRTWNWGQHVINGGQSH
jgi:predicted phosphodiesterase